MADDTRALDLHEQPPGLRGRTVLVTGASGFIGSHVVRRLVREEARVHAFIRPASRPGTPDGLPAGVTTWLGDVTEEATVRECCARVRPEIVIHLAADTSVRRFARAGKEAWEAIDRSVQVNVLGTLNVLRAAIDAPGALAAFVRLGGLEEYGTAPVPFVEDAREQPISPYSASQVAATHYCQMLQQWTEAAVITLRPALVYGPGQSSDFLIPSFIEACLRGEEFELTGDGQHRDLLYIDDLLDGIVLAASRSGLHGAIINLGHGIEYPVRDIASRILGLTGARAALRIADRGARSHGLRHLVTSNARAASLLGWSPRVSLDDGLARTVDWYRARMEER